MFWIWVLYEISLCVDLLELRQIASSFPEAEQHNLKHLVYINLAVKGHSQCTISHKY